MKSINQKRFSPAVRDVINRVVYSNAGTMDSGEARETIYERKILRSPSCPLSSYYVK